MQKSIRTIQAEPTQPKRLRVAAYARVSCDKDSIRKSFQNGEVVNWHFMYGYNITKDSIEIDEAEATVIREVFGKACGGESFRSICRDLNDRGIRGLLGGKWSSKTAGEHSSNNHNQQCDDVYEQSSGNLP